MKHVQFSLRFKALTIKLAVSTPAIRGIVRDSLNPRAGGINLEQKQEQHFLQSVNCGLFKLHHFGRMVVRLVVDGSRSAPQCLDEQALNHILQLTAPVTDC